MIFATNLVENYDKAFETRVRHLHFPLPDEQCRREIWRRHLVPQLPVAGNVSPDQLAVYAEDICGRDIRNGVVDAAVRCFIYETSADVVSNLLVAVDRTNAGEMGMEAP